jgi:transcriptional regulator with XRE-family HTH domain
MSANKLPLADRLRNSRVELGLTQKEVVRELKTRFGITIRQNYLSQLETGEKTAPALSLLAALAQVLETSADYLLGITENSSTVHDIEEDARAGGPGGKLNQILARLPREKQTELLSVAEAYIYRNMMDILLNEVEVIGGDAALNNVLDRLEASIPGSATRRPRPGTSAESE